MGRVTDTAGVSDRVSPIFRLEIVAAPEEVDDLDHVSNVAYLRWVLRVAQAHSAEVGYDFAAYQRLGAVWVVRRHEIDYLSPAYAGDTVELATWISSWRGASSTRETTIKRADGAELCRASTLWAWISTETGKPQRIPAELRDAFAELTS